MDDRPDNRQDRRPDARPESPPSTAGPGPDPVLERLDRLSDLLMRRIDRLEERVRSLEQDNGEIINLLIAVKAGLEEASGDLIAQLEEVDDSAGADFASDDAEDGSEEGPLFEAPCGPTMLH
ncbi:hypothetical protein [Azospirillum sp. B2RO_4]|uniref:hypothetical protein n=1 Tax=Azospirillum sp. B2RO_4 TaxID=3027796 RepID=UPI003DAA410E